MYMGIRMKGRNDKKEEKKINECKYFYDNLMVCIYQIEEKEKLRQFFFLLCLPFFMKTFFFFSFFYLHI